MATSILIRTFVADGRAADPPRRRRDHLAERPGGRVGRDRRQGARPAGRDRRRARSAAMTADGSPDPRHVWVDGRIAAGRRAAPLRLRSRLPARRRRLRDAPRPRPAAPTELAEHLARLRRSADGLAIALPADARGATRARASPSSSPPRAWPGPTATPASGSRSARRRSSAAACCRPTSIRRRRSSIQAWPVPPPPAGHLERGLHLVPSAVRRDPENPLAALKTTSRADYVYARLEARTRRRRRRPVPDDRRLPVRGDVREPLPRPRRRRELATPVARLRDPAGHDADWILRWAAGVGLAPSRASLTPARPRRGRRGVPLEQRRRDPAGHPLRRRADRRRAAGPWTLRARADREAFIRGGGRRHR